MKHHFSISRLSSPPREAVQRVLDAVQLSGRIGRDVFLKPNFTYPFFKEGVTTTREVIVAVVEYLRDAGCRRIVLGEGDGGYNAFSMDDTFRAYQLESLSKSYGLEVVNVSRWPSLSLDIDSRRGRFLVNVPRPIFEEFDGFISLPVPKVHALTTISNSIKNQWGLVQDKFRVAFHCAFEEIICEICRRLPRPFALVDGTWGLTKNGPMIEGETIALGWVAACDNLFLNDVLIAELMRMPLGRIGHLCFAKRKGLVPSREDCRIPEDFADFIDTRFYLRRNVWNLLAKTTWYSRRWNHVVYFSRLSNLLHRVMYSVRNKPEDLITRGRDWS